ncbi:alpha/beta hydrolase [Bacillus spongiae]|uniref:Alpha/beta hydrolase n=1 Tax=Bacillus spongiae TaxID=2683610 RepID=A0ABU8HBM2_9BACI
MELSNNDIVEVRTIIHNYFVEKLGEGEPVIFLPAAGFSGKEGLNIAEELSDRFETHLIDLPGLGKSEGIEQRITPLVLANWVNEYMEEQHIERATLIGHSLGGAILLAFALYYPNKVDKLILLDQGHKPYPRIPTSEFGPFAYMFPLINGCVRLLGKPFLKRLAPLFMQENETVEDNIEASVKQFCERTAIEENEYVKIAFKNPIDFSVEGLNLMFGYYNLKLPKLLLNVNVPTYLVYGTFENMDDKEYRRTNKYIQKLKKHNLPVTYFPVKSGHYVHWSNHFELSDLTHILTANSSENNDYAEYISN